MSTKLKEYDGIKVGDEIVISDPLAVRNGVASRHLNKIFLVKRIIRWNNGKVGYDAHHIDTNIFLWLHREQISPLKGWEVIKHIKDNYAI